MSKRSLSSYLGLIRRLEAKAAIDLHARIEHGRLWIGETPFVPIQNSELHAVTDFKTGILTTGLSGDEIRHCKANGISYFSTLGKLHLLQARSVLDLELVRAPARAPSKPAGEATDASLRPTLLISPNGLKILDLVFGLNPAALAPFKSALSLAQHFDLDQPRISLMMRALNVRRPSELPGAIKKIPESWWKLALGHQQTKRGLSPFFEIAQPYHSLLKISYADLHSRYSKWLQKEKTLYPGPIEIARALGAYRDESFSLWGDEKSLQRLKAEFRLIPGVQKESPLWHLAVPKSGLEKEAIAINLKLVSASHLDRSNRFRAIWDLGFGNARLKEIQPQLLRSVMDAI